MLSMTLNNEVTDCCLSFPDIVPNKLNKCLLSPNKYALHVICRESQEFFFCFNCLDVAPNKSNKCTFLPNKYALRVICIDNEKIPVT